MSRADGSAGLVAGVIDAAAADLAAREAAAQLALFDEAEALLPAGRRLDVEEIGTVAVAERRAGRPKGAVNKGTRELRDYLGARGFDAVLEQVRWAFLSPEELAARLGCTREAAFDRKMTLLDRLAPYQHARLAPTDTGGNAVPLLAMTIGGRLATPDTARPPWQWDVEGVFVDVPQSEQDQGLGDAPSGQSQIAQSQAEGKP